MKPFFKKVSQQEFQDHVDRVPLLTGHSKYEGWSNRAGRYHKTFLFHVKEVIGTKLIPDEHPVAIISFSPGTGNRYFVATTPSS